MVFCEELSEPADAELVAQRISDVPLEPFELDGRSSTITASVGVAFSGAAERLPSELLRDADFGTRVLAGLDGGGRPPG